MIHRKAGYKEGVKNHHECCKMDYQAGIKEVVKWIKSHIADPFPYAKEEWEAKLKEWNL